MVCEICGEKQAMSDSQITILKALADPTRLRLIRILFREVVNVQELAHILEVPQPTVSRHLAALRKAKLVHDRREGTKIYCALQVPEDLPTALAAYLEEIGHSEHPDLERLGECLRSRACLAQSFADGSAEQWDAVGRLLHSSSAALVALANLAPRGLTVADMGTGTGLMLPFLSEVADRVYAIDQSAAMLQKARQRCEELKIQNVIFMQGSIESLCGDLPPCDGVLLHMVMHQVASPAVLLRHLVHSLKPRGRVVIVDRLEHQDEQAKTTFGSLWLGFAESQMLSWLEHAGLGNATWHPLPAAPDSANDVQPGLFVAVAENLPPALD
jgi:ArsR family transcriptional regulator